MGQMIRVGMADMNFCHAPDAITTLGLGSCVGVVLYDPVVKVAGLVHVMLPDSKVIQNNANKAKFADTGIREMLRVLLKQGARSQYIRAKIAGGAQMFAFHNEKDMIRVGDQNAEAVKKALQELNIPLVASDTGKNYGRTIEFYPENEKLLIKAVGKTQYTI